jgi:hypothetical protein
LCKVEHPYTLQCLHNRGRMKSSLVDGLVDKGKQNDQQGVPAWNHVIPYEDGKKVHKSKLQILDNRNNK